MKPPTRRPCVDQDGDLAEKPPGARLRCFAIQRNDAEHVVVPRSSASPPLIIKTRDPTRRRFGGNHERVAEIEVLESYGAKSRHER